MNGNATQPRLSKLSVERRKQNTKIIFKQLLKLQALCLPIITLEEWLKGSPQENASD